MFTISFIGSKGGCGKTTSAIGLAVAATRAGKIVALIDLDPQATAANWKDRRGEEGPAVISAQASRLRQTLDAARAADAEFAIIDTAGRNDDSALNAARASDLVFVPSKAVIGELETLGKVQDQLRLGGSPRSFVLLNRIEPGATKQFEDARRLIEQTFGLRVCPFFLSQLRAYENALETGQTAQEIDPKGKSAGELEHLYRFASERVNLVESVLENIGESEHGEKLASGS
jgi:chromosome partitioning protein